MTRKHKHQNQ